MEGEVDQITWLQNNAKSQADVIGKLVTRLAAVEMQRDALAGACRAYVADYEDTFISPEEMTGESKNIYTQCQEALALTPEHAASVVEDLRDALEGLLTATPYGSDWESLQLAARRALAGPGKGGVDS